MIVPTSSQQVAGGGLSPASARIPDKSRFSSQTLHESRGRLTRPEVESKVYPPALVWLLVAGLVLAPMTGWRLGKIGPSEVIVALWIVGTLVHLARSPGRLDVGPYRWFWPAFLAFITIGTFIGISNYPDEVDTVGLVTWGFFALFSTALYGALRGQNLAETLIARVSLLGIALYFFFYMYSITVSTSFLGASLVYGNARFSGGGENPHQVAIFLMLAAASCVRLALQRNGTKRKLLYLGFSLVAIWLATETKSDTFTLALAAGGIVLFLYLFTRIVESTATRVSILFLGLGLFALTLLFTLERLTNFVQAYIQGSTNGESRLVLWQAFTSSLERSPLFGLGPGAHSIQGQLGYYEFHNSYLDIAAMGGFSALLLFLGLLVYSLKRMISSDPTLLLIAIPLFVYATAGFAVRRTLFWGFLTLLLLVVVDRTRTRTDIQRNVEPESLDPPEHSLKRNRGSAQRLAVSTESPHRTRSNHVENGLG